MSRDYNIDDISLNTHMNRFKFKPHITIVNYYNMYIIYYIHKYRKNNCSLSLCIMIMHSDGHRSFYPRSAIPIPIPYLFSYLILFLIPILHLLSDHFPNPIPIISFLPDPDPYHEPDPDPYPDIIYIFN